MSLNENVYTINSLHWCILSFYRILLIGFFISFFTFSETFGQPAEEYYEILVFAQIPKVGATDLPAVIKGEDLYLSVSDLFNFVRIKNEISSDADLVTGFFITPQDEFRISRSDNIIEYAGKSHRVNQGDLIRTESTLFLRTDYFGKVFGLDCQFDFRNLIVNIKTNLDLPAIREMRQAEIRKNLNKLKGELVADTIIDRTFPVLRFGMADWQVYSSQEITGETNSRISLNLGAMAAGGELKASLNYNSDIPFTEKNQHYLWRFADNDLKFMKQLLIGKIATQSLATLSNNVIGAQITNTPTTYRRSFGTYTLSDRTEPEWIVELYVNNVLVDYVKADASGFFQFQVPLVYGNSLIQMKFYGPWGEEKTREQNISIPYNFIPEKTIEYKISAGLVQDSVFSRFSRVAVNYGLSRTITIGGGVEYLSSLLNTPVMPYINASLSIFNNLLLSGEYAYGVRSKGTLSYRSPSNIQLNLDYTKYAKDQEALFFNYLEERKAALTIPFKINKLSVFNRFSLTQIILPPPPISYQDIAVTPSYYLNGDWTISGLLFGVNTNLTTFATVIKNNQPNIYSNLSLAVRLPAKMVFRPQIQYGYNKNELISARIGLEKSINRNAFLNASFDRIFFTKTNLAELGFRYNFNFAQTGMSVRHNDDKTSLIEYARGSLVMDRKTRYIGASSQNNVGKGAISVIPFLDLNANGIKDRSEPKANGLNLHVTTGRVEKSEKDTTIRILGLEPYTSCYIDLDDKSFENMAWKLTMKVLNVIVDPEIVKHIEIPVTVVGEASGYVSLTDADNAGTGGIILRFKKGKKSFGSTMSEDGGYYTLFGLEPGNYTVMPDSLQLTKLGMTSEPLYREFNIQPGQDGDIIDGLDFMLKVIESDTITLAVKKPAPATRKDTTLMIVHEVVEELVTITKDSWAIQLGAFKSKANADNLRKNLAKLLNRKVDLVIADGFFKVRIDEIPERKEVDEIVVILRNNGFTELWIISLRAKQQHVVLVEREDSVIKVVETTIEEPELFESKVFIPMTSEFYSLERPKNSLIEQTIFEIMKSHSSLEKMEFKDIRPVVRIVRTDTTEIIIPGIKEPERIGPATKVREDTKVEKISISYDIGERINPSPAVMMFGAPPEKPVVPVISLQVGVYNKKSDAVKARKKIMSKLNLPVKIVEQWEFYRVIITGFSSREETFQYYPELAGLGFPGPTLIEE